VTTALVVALAIWALARMLGVELTVGKGPDASSVGAADVLVTVVLAGLAAWGAHTLLARRGAAGWWPFVGSTALAMACRRHGERRADRHAPSRWLGAHRRLHEVCLGVSGRRQPPRLPSTHGKTTHS
jgi:hypothetical protein